MTETANRRGRGRPRVLTPEQEAELVTLRAVSVPWKELQQIFGMGRTQLFEAWRRASAAAATAADAGRISEHLS